MSTKINKTNYNADVVIFIFILIMCYVLSITYQMSWRGRIQWLLTDIG